MRNLVQAKWHDQLQSNKAIFDAGRIMNLTNKYHAFIMQLMSDTYQMLINQLNNQMFT